MTKEGVPSLMPAALQQPMVGREDALGLLKAKFEAALSGSGSLTLVTGEAGMGKTRLVTEASALGVALGLAPLWGHCFEGESALPYRPWADVVQQATQLKVTAELEADLLADVGRLLPDADYRRREQNTSQRAGADRLRLFDSVTDYLLAMAQGQPVLVVLEDLHWADQSSLELLQHVARRLPSARMAFLATYRDGEDGGPHQASMKAGLLERRLAESISLKGLDEGETRVLISNVCGREPASISPAVAEAVRKQTDGNPFLIAEGVQQLAAQRSGRWLIDPRAANLAMSDGIRSTLGRRLARLSPGTHALLTAMALTGGDSSFEVLRVLDSVVNQDTSADGAGDHRPSEANLIARIEEGLQARVIEELTDPVRYRFVHALMREALLDGVSATRRSHLHGLIGEALEVHWGEQAAAHAGQLGMHFTESATLQPQHVELAYRYSLAAAQVAEAQTAWPEAFALYERCVHLHRSGVGLVAEDIAPTLLAAARTGHWAPSRRAVEYAFEAEALFRSRGDGEGFARAVTLALDDIETWGTDHFTLAAEALSMLDGTVPAVEADLLCAVITGGVSDRMAYTDADPGGIISRARELAGSGAFHQLSGALAALDGARARARNDLPSATNACIASYREFEIAESYYGGFELALAALCEQFAGRLDAALRISETRRQFVTERHYESQRLHNLMRTGFVGLIRSDPQLIAMASEAHDLEGIVGFHWVRWRVRERRGEATMVADRALRQVEGYRANPSNRGYLADNQGNAARLLYLAERIDEAAEALERWEADYRIVDEWDPMFSIGGLSSVDEVLPALGSTAILELVLARLSLLSSYRCSMETALDHLRGDIALKLGRFGEAERWYETGLEWAAGERCPFEEARCLRGLGEVALVRGDVERARHFWESAEAGFTASDAPFFASRVAERMVSLPVGAPLTHPRKQFPGGLTEREVTVLRWMASGATNQEIAATLVISQRTAERHVANILSKLGVTNRTQAASWAQAHGVLAEDIIPEP